MAIELRLGRIPLGRRKLIVVGPKEASVGEGRLHLGLLINFNVPILNDGLQRVILS